MNIGVFDSGIGGQAVANCLAKLFPAASITSINDHDNMPYGNRSDSDIISLTESAIQPLLEAHCDAIVIACNTATTVAISALRTTYPDVDFIGIEPMVKPAVAITKTGHIAVFATPSTLKSDRYHYLKQRWASDITVVEPDCSDWAKLIEYGKAEEIDVEKTVHEMMQQQVDVIVLACTHYHWLKQRIIQAAGDAVTVLEPSDAIGARIKSILSSKQ